MTAIFEITKVDPETGVRLDTYDDKMTEAQLDAYLANALETKTDRYGSAIYRFADGWMSYIQTAE